MSLFPLQMAQGEALVARIHVSDADGAAAALAGLVLHLVVIDAHGETVTALCRGTGAGIEAEVAVGSALATWNRTDSLDVAIGTYSYSLWSEDASVSPSEVQQLIAWSPLSVTRGVAAFPV